MNACVGSVKLGINKYFPVKNTIYFITIKTFYVLIKSSFQKSLPPFNYIKLLAFADAFGAFTTLATFAAATLLMREKNRLYS